MAEVTTRSQQKGEAGVIWTFVRLELSHNLGSARAKADLLRQFESVNHPSRC